MGGGGGVTVLDGVTGFDGLGGTGDDGGGSPAGSDGGAGGGTSAFVLKRTWLTPADFIAAVSLWHAAALIPGEQLIRPRTAIVPETGSLPAASRVFPG